MFEHSLLVVVERVPVRSWIWNRRSSPGLPSESFSRRLTRSRWRLLRPSSAVDDG